MSTVSTSSPVMSNRRGGSRLIPGRKGRGPGSVYFRPGSAPPFCEMTSGQPNCRIGPRDVFKVAVDPPTHIDPFGSSASVHPRWAAWRKGPAEEAARPPVGRNAQRIHGEPINRLPVAMAEGFAEPGLCRSPPTNSERFGYLPTRGTAALLRICWRTASGARC